MQLYQEVKTLVEKSEAKFAKYEETIQFLENIAKKCSIEVEGKVLKDMNLVRQLDEFTTNLIMEEGKGIIALFQSIKIKELLTDRKIQF